MKLPDISESSRRLYEKLYRDLGENIIAFLKDSAINEIMLNPDGKLWIDQAKQGKICVGSLTKEAFSIMHSVAGYHLFVISQHSPIVEAELPFYQAMQGERFTGKIPPLVSAPCFTIRKKSESIFTLDDYVSTQRMTPIQASALRQLIVERKNILICGGPGSGETTVTNAMIVEAVKIDKNQRFLLLEDLPELQCSATNKISMLTSSHVNIKNLLKEAMRMRPDRILIGEVCGAEALDMLKAWTTSCPSGICTVHANGTEEAVQRITFGLCFLMISTAFASGTGNLPFNSNLIINSWSVA